MESINNAVRAGSAETAKGSGEARRLGGVERCEVVGRGRDAGHKRAATEASMYRGVGPHRPVDGPDRVHAMQAECTADEVSFSCRPACGSVACDVLQQPPDTSTHAT